MARKRYKPEEIVGKLRQAEVLHGQGMVSRITLSVALSKTSITSSCERDASSW